MPTRKNFRERRQTRREEAEKRAVARQARSNQDQLELIKTRPGTSAREVAKLS